MIIAYLRVGVEKQENDKQKQLILEYAQTHQLIIDELLEATLSSKKSQEQRKIAALKSRLNKGDVLITTDLSKLGRGMLEVMNLLLELSQIGIQFIFVKQKELSTFQSNTEQLILTIYAHIAETEKEFLSMRTKEGLAAAKAQGKILGRPKGRTSISKWDKYEQEVIEYIQKDLDLGSIWKLIGKEGTYHGFYMYCRRNKKIVEALRIEKDKSTSLIARMKK